MSETPWDVLGVDESADSREIKRAYARKLRDNRPDDDPVGFQKLHEAYQFALVRAQYSQQAMVEAEPSEVIEVSVSPEELINVSVQTAEPPPEEPELTPEQQAKLDEAAADVDQLLSETLSVNSPKRWRFLTESVELIDDVYRIELGARVLDKVLRHNAKIREAKRFDVVQSHIIGSLDNVFFWTSNPWNFVTEENAEDAFQLLSEIDAGRRAPPAKPVGGKIVKKPTVEREPRRVVSTSDSSDGKLWMFISAVWILGMLGKSCAQIG